LLNEGGEKERRASSLGSATGRAMGVANTPDETVARTETTETIDFANIMGKWLGDRAKNFNPRIGEELKSEEKEDQLKKSQKV